MEINVIDQPLLKHKLTLLRDENTSSPLFRQLVKELVTLLAYEATKNIAIEKVEIKTPVSPMVGYRLSKPRPLIVPIIRAGLGMLDGMMEILPSAEVGFLGMKRNEETLDNVTYANRLPEDIKGRQCYILDPMLATGGTILSASNYLTERGAKDITAICLLGAPEGIEFLKKNISPNIDLKIFLPALDEKLNDKGYIVPGLGDAGDRLYGVVD